MRLTSFRITNYRCIDDSGDVSVDPRVTCLVGKNEAGKTAILESLRKLNPAQPASFDQTKDFPRMRLRQYERELKQPGSTPALVVQAKFELTDDDVKAVESITCEGIMSSRCFELSLGYARSFTPCLQFDIPRLIGSIVSGSGWADKVSEVKSLADLKSLLSLSGGEEDTKKLLAKIQLFTAKPLQEMVWDRVLKARVPTFMFFDAYSTMTGSVPLSQLATEDRNRLDPGQRTLRELLDIAGTTPNELMSDSNYEQHKAGLEATANDITREVFEYWRQNSDLEVEFDVHRPQQGGEQAKATFHVRIKNRRHGVTVPFDERSRGFVWFFSFLVAFRRLVEEGKPVIILLDEPGLNLHGKAQADLLRFIEERLAPFHQVIFTTHSPFMVDAQHLDRVRTVEDAKGKGTTVSAECLTRDSDTLFPLQAALGYDVAQSLFVAPDCLLVEGPSDLLYLRAMSSLCASRGFTHLHERWVITPVGGADKLAAFVALMGANNLNLVVLMDIAKNERQRIDNLVKRNLLEASRILEIGKFNGQLDADIEDLFSADVYLGIAQKIIGQMDRPLDLNSLPEGPRIVKRIEKAIGRGFDHYAVAVQAVAASQSIADEPTLSRFAALFDAVNAKLRGL